MVSANPTSRSNIRSQDDSNEIDVLEGLRFKRLENCPNCNYSLEGLPDDRPCPECGLPLEPNVLLFQPNKSLFIKLVIWIQFGFAAIINFFSIFVFLKFPQSTAAGNPGLTSPTALTTVVIAVPPLIYTAMAFGSWYFARKPKFAVIGEKRFLWYSWLRGRRTATWKDVADVRVNTHSGGIVLVGRNRNSFPGLSVILQISHTRDARRAALPVIRRMWLSIVGEKLRDVPPMTLPDTITSRFNLSHIARDDAHIFEEAQFSIHPMSLKGLVGMTAMAALGYYVLTSSDCSNKVSLIGAVVGAVLASLIFSIDYYRNRRRRHLEVDDSGFTWGQIDGEMVELHWNQIAAVAMVPDTNTICIRMNDETLLPIPVEFIPPKVSGLEFAQFLANRRPDK